MEKEKEYEREKLKEEKRVARLENKIASMIQKLEGEIQKVDSEVGESFNLIDKNKDGLITWDEVRDALKLMKEQLTEEEIDQLLRRLDKNQDGIIEVDYLKLLGSDVMDLRTWLAVRSVHEL